MADPGPDGVLGGDRAGHHRGGQRPARRLRRAADPDGQLRRQPLPRGRTAAQAAGQGHELLAAGRRLPELRAGRDGARRGPGHGQGRRRYRGCVPRGRVRPGQRDRDAAGGGPAGSDAGRAAGGGPAGQPASAQAAAGLRPSSSRLRPSLHPGRCARPARRPTRPARGSAWAAASLSRLSSSTARNAAPNYRPALTSAPVAAPGSAASPRLAFSPNPVPWPRGRCHRA